MQRFDIEFDTLAASDKAELCAALDAVCAELGIARHEGARRADIKRRMADAWRHGRTQPLYLVDAGLSAARA